MLTLSLKKDIKDLMDRMDFGLLDDPEIKEEDGIYFVSLFVDEPRTLIGERGHTLRSVESIFRIMSVKKYGPDVRISLDVNGYKQKRAEFLKSLAYSTRQRVIKENKNIELEPMNAFDRRIIHAALSEYQDIETESAGEDQERRVVVRLA
ncbi:MAG: R3H domain-containing nucleic acid-binding protein [Candidatus Spechtbacterales bacterium]